jgi:cobalamin biosynthesis Mg chelatase CobN
MKEYEVPVNPNFKVHGTTKPKQKGSHTKSPTDQGTKGSVGGESAGEEAGVSGERPQEPQEAEPRTHEKETKTGATAPGGGGGNKPKGGGGGGESAAPYRAGGAVDHVGPAEKVAGGASDKVVPMEAAEPQREAVIGAGSSPVVPILIAAIVLAAISIGVAYRRQRRSEEGLGGRPHSA